MGLWDDPTTWWLNLTNVGLGLMCLGPIVIVLGAVFQDSVTSLARRIQRRRLQADTHAFEVPGLGLTMADGGKPIQAQVSAPTFEQGAKN
jgi:hypothetical protein